MAFKMVESPFKTPEYSLKCVGLSRYRYPLYDVKKLATNRLTLRYGLAAIVIAVAVIGSSLILGPKTVKAQTNFVVMLTDPPNVPEGTTKLEVTYSNIQLHVKYSDGTSQWVASQESGEVDLLSLVSVSQTIASVNLPTGSTVDKLQFTISSAKATIKDVEYDVDILSKQLIVNLKETKLDGTNTGALIDLRPTLYEIRSVDSDGAPVSYYVLVPSANAVLKSNVSEEHSKVGAKKHLTDDENEELEDEYVKASRDVTIKGATLSVDANGVTSISVTLLNKGTKSVMIHGLTIHGDFNFPKADSSKGNSQNDKDDDHPRTIPFQISGDKLIPRIGGDDEHKENDKGFELTSTTEKTFTFTGKIQMKPDEHGKATPITITPIKDGKYTIRVSGEGSQTFEVTATSS